jgi:hypothetical protein
MSKFGEWVQIFISNPDINPSSPTPLGKVCVCVSIRITLTVTHISLTSHARHPVLSGLCSAPSLSAHHHTSGASAADPLRSFSAGCTIMHLCKKLLAMGWWVNRPCRPVPEGKPIGQPHTEVHVPSAAPERATRASIGSWHT